MNSYLIIDIKSAKFYSDVTKSFNPLLGIFIEKPESEKRFFNFRNLEKVFTVHQISAMLHVLFGYRPVSYYNPSEMYSRVEWIDEIAQHALIRIDSFSDEFAQGKYLDFKSNRKGVFTSSECGETYKGWILWKTFKNRYYFNTSEKARETYLKTMEFFHEICKDESMFKKYELIDFLHHITENEETKQKCIDFFKENHITPFIDIINHNFRGSTDTFNRHSPNLTSFHFACQENLHKPLRTVVIDGKIAVPLTEKQLVSLKEGKKCATFGDNGLAKIQNVLYNCDENFLIYGQDYIHIKTISEV